MTDDFYRIRRLPPYVFAEVNAMKAAARARGEDIVDLGMGNPDGAPPRHVIDKLAEVAAKPTAHRYSASKGIPGLRKAQAAYYQRRFGVEVDPDSEVIVTLGSKEGLANLAQAITAPGDVVLTPNPSYPIHHFGFIIAGASIRSIPAVPGPDFFDRLERAIRYTVPTPKVLVIGYPSNPTAQVVDLHFYEQLVAFAKAEGLWVISDLAYAESAPVWAAPVAVVRAVRARSALAAIGNDAAAGRAASVRDRWTTFLAAAGLSLMVAGAAALGHAAWRARNQSERAPGSVR